MFLQPTLRNKLGARALKFLKKGKACDDQLLVEIMVDAIRRVEEGSGWVIDGFPATTNQAKLLEKALTGDEGSLGSKTDLSAKKKGKSRLAPDQRAGAPAGTEAMSGLDVVVLFELSDELALRRSAGRTCESDSSCSADHCSEFHCFASDSMQTNEQFHEEFRPPPEGTVTGMADDKVLPVEDHSNDQEQIMHRWEAAALIFSDYFKPNYKSYLNFCRLKAFNDAWPRLEKWYMQNDVLKSVDASLPQESSFLEFEKILEDTIKRVSAACQYITHRLCVVRVARC